jgi:cytochrome c biogenesis protein CcmG/thiol:disulfide interchange protein DsbE
VKNRFIIPLIVFALLAAVLFYGIKRAPDKHFLASVLIGKPVPEFSLPNLMEPGKTVTSKQLQGKPYVINVWGTWCGACREEHQALLDIQQLGQVPLVGINWRDQDDLALSWLAQLGNPYTHVAVDKQGRLPIDLGVYGAPETFLIDANGIIVHKHTGAMTMEVFKRDFEPKLHGTSPAGRS